MAEGITPEPPFLWTRGIAARETLRYLEKRGIDVEPLLSRMELSRHQLADDDRPPISGPVGMLV
jgi:hypothetical protein